MFTDFGFQVCDKIYHLISQHFNPTFIEITCAELHEKLEVAATEEQIKKLAYSSKTCLSPKLFYWSKSTILISRLTVL